ncbi:hypothetical protein [Nocardia brasiliensis]|uniref:hypothetical protein n=1 Tax=Nocardia brasiliensis TaxID=37326 RepID=UPI0024573B54|nr:hypothetical protein [Nocardia brasiliensis]
MIIAAPIAVPLATPLGVAAALSATALGAGLGQTLGARFGDGFGWSDALDQGAIVGAASVGLGMAGPAIVRTAARSYLMRLSAKSDLKMKIGDSPPPASMLTKMLTHELGHGTVGAISRMGLPLAGIPLVSRVFDDAEDSATQPSVPGVWIGGPGDGLAEHFPAALGAGFLFRPDNMPQQLWDWYTQFAELMRTIWTNFGNPAESARPRRGIELPRAVSEVPANQSGKTIDGATDVSFVLQSSIRDFMEVENLLAMNCSRTTAAVQRGKSNVLELLKDLNRMMHMGVAGNVEPFELLINAAVESATRIVDETTLEGRNIANEIARLHELMPCLPPR